MPRRKSRAAPTETSTPAEENTPTETGTSKAGESPVKPTHNINRDHWTDEQEISLLKGVIKWKPAGMHKHFRMIALSEYLRNHGYDPKFEVHTRIPGIWDKLRTLYNLEVIDERENSFDYEEEGGEEKYVDFELPEAEYGRTMWERGVADSAASSPPQLNRSPSPQTTATTATTTTTTTATTRKRKRRETVAKVRASTIDDTDEAQTSPISSPAPRGGRSARGNRRGGRGGFAARDRRHSKDTPVEEEEEEEEEDNGEEDEESSDGDDDDDEDTTPSAKPQRGGYRGRRGGTGRGQNSTRKSTRKK